MPSAHWARGLSAIGDGSLLSSSRAGRGANSMRDYSWSDLVFPPGYVPLQRQDPLGSLFLFHPSFLSICTLPSRIVRTLGALLLPSGTACAQTLLARPTFTRLWAIARTSSSHAVRRRFSGLHHPHCVVAASGRLREQSLSWTMIVPFDPIFPPLSSGLLAALSGGRTLFIFFLRSTHCLRVERLRTGGARHNAASPYVLSTCSALRFSRVSFVSYLVCSCMYFFSTPSSCRFSVTCCAMHWLLTGKQGAKRRDGDESTSWMGYIEHR